MVPYTPWNVEYLVIFVITMKPHLRDAKVLWLTHTMWQLCGLQVALKEKEGVQTHAEQRHRGELARVAEERDAVQDKLTQLQDKVDPQKHHTSVLLGEKL